MLDVRNNLIWNFGKYGTVITSNGTANVVNNYYRSRDATAYPTGKYALRVELGGIAFANGNYGDDGGGKDINLKGNRSTPYPAASVTTADPKTAACDVFRKAGAIASGKWERDSIDQRYVSQIQITGGCP